MNCEDCLRKEKKIKVLLSDHSFELRKLTQDKAEERALYEISVQKQLRKWQEKYHKEKQDHDQNSKKWLNKIDQQASSCQTQIKQIRLQSVKEIEEFKIQTKSKTETQKQNILLKHQQELSLMRLRHAQEKESIQTSYKGQLEQMEKKYLSQISQLKKINKDREDALIKDYESIVFGLKTEKSAQMKQNQRLQEESRRERSKYLSQIYDHKTMIKDLQTNIKQLKTNLATKERQLEQKKADMTKMCKQHTIALEQAEREKAKLDRQWKQTLDNQLKTFCQKELQITQLYEESVKNIQEKRQTEKDLYRNNVNQINACMENRPSRVQDLEEIMILRQKLGKKEKEYDMLEREVKHIQLELENKEDTYNRIFIPSMNSAHLNQNTILKRKELKLKRVGKSVSTVRDILNAVNVNYNNLPSLHSIEKKYLPPKSNKIL